MSATRQAFLPAPTLPLVYFGGAHVALAAAASTLVIWPDLPGAFHYHPRMIAVIHLVTLGWISASILGAFYIVAPLALGMPFAARTPDVVACALFWAGAATMVTGFWRADYAVVGAASLAVIAAIGIVALRAIRGLRVARLPIGVSLHVALAFANILGAGLIGAGLAAGRTYGLVTWSPLALANAHAHAAVLGWAVMMILGLSYRLVPMFLPAAMPRGRGLVWSAVLLEIGTVGLVWSIASGGSPLVWSLVVVGAIVAFVHQVRRILGDRRPRPAGLAGRNWPMWQTHVALMYLAAAAGMGVCLAAELAPPSWIWAYGVAGLVGFVAQMVVGIQGRLLPLHAWYRAMAMRDGAPPPRAVHGLHDSRLAAAVMLLWTGAVPGLAIGLTRQTHALIAGSASLLLVATALQAVHMTRIARRAGRPLAAA
jgi:hypothetical protein